MTYDARSEGSQSRRADGEALTGGRRGVPERIEHVGAVADKAGWPDISALPPALSAMGPYASVASVMPNVESMPTAAIPTP